MMNSIQVVGGLGFNGVLAFIANVCATVLKRYTWELLKDPLHITNKPLEIL